MIRRLRAFAIYCARWIAHILFYYPKIISAWTTRRSGKTSFIIEAKEGARQFDNGLFAIFLIWQPETLSWYVRNALEALAEAKVNVILVVNHPLNGAMEGQLIASCRQILIRDNTGFDIGGYQDATKWLRDNCSVDRLLYLNDSVYYFREGLTDTFDRLANSKADVCSVFENWEFTYHVQSFCFSISRQVFDSPAFVNFWNNYLPVNSRLWAIQRGEIGLSKAIVPHSKSFEVIYSPNDVRDKIGSLGQDELLQINKYLPIRIRFNDIGSTLQRQTIEDHLINQLSSYSQIHTGGFLYRKFLGNPLIKRDLVYRAQFSIYDVEHCLKAIGHEDHLDEILSDMRRKGNGNQLPLLKKIQFMEGII
jgi:hypothetical protein